MKKKQKIGLSLSPSAQSANQQFERLSPLVTTHTLNNLDIQDSQALAIYLESLSAWMTGYFFSRLSLDCCQLPQVPNLENSELFDVCVTLRNTIGNVREQAIKKLSNPELKLKEISEKTKSSHQLRGKSLKDPNDDKKLNNLIDSTLLEARKKGLRVDLMKPSLFSKCEELCRCLLKASSENLFSKLNKNEASQNRLIKSDDYTNKLKNECDGSVVRVIYPLITRILDLQEKKKFYSLLYRHYERSLKIEELEIRSILDINLAKPKSKIKKFFLFAFSAFCIFKLKGFKENTVIKGLTISLIDQSLVPNKSVTISSLPNIILSIHKTIGSLNKNRSTLNSLISSSISGFHKLMNDTKTVLAILLKSNNEQKDLIQHQICEIQDLEQEKEELEGALSKTIEYSKNLEEELIEITGDPDYVREIGEETEIVIELESHRKALKGLTSQYNQLEHKHSKTLQEFEAIKQENLEKQRKIENLEKKINK